MNTIGSELSGVNFFNWRSVLSSALCTQAWLSLLTANSLQKAPHFSAFSWLDGFPNRWYKGAFLLPLATFAQGSKADLARLADAINTQTPILAYRNQPLRSYVQIQAPSQAFLTFTLSASAWAELSVNTLSAAATYAAPSLGLVSSSFLITPAWRRAAYRLAWLRKADSRNSQTQAAWLPRAVQIYDQPQLRQLLAQVESLCFYYAEFLKGDYAAKPPLKAQRLEGQLSNLLKDFHDFYRNTKILSGDLLTQKALLNLAQAVGCALNLYTT